LQVTLEQNAGDLLAEQTPAPVFLLGTAVSLVQRRQAWFFSTSTEGTSFRGHGSKYAQITATTLNNLPYEKYILRRLSERIQDVFWSTLIVQNCHMVLNHAVGISLVVSLLSPSTSPASVDILMV